MKRTRFLIGSVTAVLVIVLMLSQAIISTRTGDMASAAQAQAGSGYDLTWNTIDGGGGTSSGGGYTLSGTVGQADAGASVSGTYTIVGGFWAGLAGFRLDLPLILR